MSKTIKKILDIVNDRIGMSRQDQYYGSAESQALTITAIANEALEEFSQENFSKLRKEGTITLTTAETYSLPSDLRYIVADTMQANDQERWIDFPVNTAEWYYFKSRTTSNGLNYKFRIAGGQLEVDNPESGQVIIYEYITDKLVIPSGSSTATKTEFTADTDTYLMDDGLIIRYIMWKYKFQKGIEGWQLDKQIYDKYYKIHTGNEAGSKTINFGINQNTPEMPHYNRWQ